MIYVVCTECPFLRAYGSHAQGSGALDACPVCGGELVVHESSARFPPAYVSRVAMNVLAAPALDQEPPSQSLK